MDNSTTNRIAARIIAKKFLIKLYDITHPLSAKASNWFKMATLITPKRESFTLKINTYEITDVSNTP